MKVVSSFLVTKALNGNSTACSVIARWCFSNVQARISFSQTRMDSSEKTVQIANFHTTAIKRLGILFKNGLKSLSYGKEIQQNQAFRESRARFSAPLLIDASYRSRPF